MRRATPFLWLALGLAGLSLTGLPAAWADDPGGNPALSYTAANPNTVTVVYNAGCPQQPDCIKYSDWNGCVSPSTYVIGSATYQSFTLLTAVAFGYCQEGSIYTGKVTVHGSKPLDFQEFSMTPRCQSAQKRASVCENALFSSLPTRERLPGKNCCKYETLPCYNVNLCLGLGCSGATRSWVIYVKDACPPDPNDPLSSSCET